MRIILERSSRRARIVGEGAETFPETLQDDYQKWQVGRSTIPHDERSDQLKVWE
ncbi:MAG: hypothetical protein AB7K24_02130 [Gemmataceae bacterium]